MAGSSAPHVFRGTDPVLTPGPAPVTDRQIRELPGGGVCGERGQVEEREHARIAFAQLPVELREFGKDIGDFRLDELFIVPRALARSDSR